MTAEPDVNPVVEAIVRRSSVREGFTLAPVPVEIVEDVVRCGLAAPSSKNGRPWRFHVVMDRLLLGELAAAVESGEGLETYVPCDAVTGRPRPELDSSVKESAGVLRSAPLAIFVEDTGEFSGGREALLAATPESLAASIVGFAFELVGLGAAIQNMWVAAVSHGLSGVFLGDVLIAEGAIKKRLAISRDLVGALALGYVSATSHRTELGRAGDTSRVTWHL